jgi:hypothetical protein
MMLRCAGNINYVMWKSTDQHRFIIYFQMPSETVQGLFYDVAVEFTAQDDVHHRLGHLKDYKVRFFSNDPNFIFTYAYAYKQKDLIIPELVNKIGAKARKEEPKKTNPNMLAGYVKSIYFAYLFMVNKGLFNKLAWMEANPISNFRSWASKFIMHSDKKLIYAQHFTTVAKQAGRRDRITPSESDPNGLRNAATAIKTKEKYAKTVQSVRRTQAITAKRNRENSHFVKTVGIIGRHK